MGFNAANEDLAFATPRSWEMVSNLLNVVSDDLKKMFNLIAGLVGTGVAVEFLSWSKTYAQMPDIKDIFDGKMPPIPTGTDALYALTSAMLSYARSHKNNMDKIANSIRYADKLPPDYSAMLLKDYLYIEKGYKEKLMKIPEFSRWISSKGRLLNGTV